jgi:hypothetical protein
MLDCGLLRWHLRFSWRVWRFEGDWLTVWVFAPCWLVEIDRCFRNAYCLHHSSPWWWRQWPPDYTALHPRRQSSSYGPLTLHHFLPSEWGSHFVTQRCDCPQLGIDIQNLPWMRNVLLCALLYLWPYLRADMQHLIGCLNKAFFSFCSDSIKSSTAAMDPTHAAQ